MHHNQCCGTRFLLKSGLVTRSIRKNTIRLQQTPPSPSVLRQVGNSSSAHLAKFAPRHRRKMCRFISIDSFSARGFFWFWKDHGDSFLFRQSLATNFQLSSQLALCSFVLDRGQRVSRIASTGFLVDQVGEPHPAQVPLLPDFRHTHSDVFRCDSWLHGCVFSEHRRNTSALVEPREHSDRR